jgi:selenocysteine lyase/cysteine desulfurase
VSEENGARRYPRRELLVRGGVIAGAAALAGAGGYVAAREVSGDDHAVAAPPDKKEGPLFALDPAYTNLATFLLAQHPRPVREAIERHRAGLDAGTELYIIKAAGYEDEARASAADYLGTGPDQVALTDSTTMGIALAYAQMRFERGDEVLTTEHDFYATHESLRLRQERDGIVVKKVRLYPLEAPETASTEAIVSAIAKGITRKTRAVAITWVHSSSGVRLPLAEIAAAIADANDGRGPSEQILLCVDGIHGFGAVDASPVDLGVHVFASGCHKWLFGPRGTGLVWAASDAWERLGPTIPSFDGAAYAAWLFGNGPDVAPGALNSPGGFHSFEHRWALKEAFAVHAEELGGRAKVAATTHALATRLKEGLAEIDGVTVKTPMDENLSAGLVAAELDRFQARDVDALREQHKVVTTVTPYAIEYLRFGPSVANTEEDVDAALAAVAALA